MENRLWQSAMASLSILTSIPLLFIIYKDKTPSMQRYNIFFIKITLATFLISLCAGFGGQFENLYPLPAFKINGFFTVFGSSGGPLTFFLIATITSWGMISVAETTAYRCVLLYEFNLEIGKFLIVSSDVLALIFTGAAFFLLTFYFISDEELTRYGIQHGLSSNVQAINTGDILMTYKINDLSFYFFANILLLCIIIVTAAALIISFLSIAIVNFHIMDSHEKGHFLRFTVALVLKILIPGCVGLSYVLVIWFFGKDTPGSMELARISGQICSVYPPVSAFLDSVVTFILIQPYRETMKRILLSVVRIKRRGPWNSNATVLVIS